MAAETHRVTRSASRRSGSHYHVRKLEDAGLVAGVRRRVRGIHKGIYQASARSYWLSPQLVGTIGRQLGLGYLLNLVEEVQTDLAGLEQHPYRIPVDTPRPRRAIQ